MDKMDDVSDEDDSDNEEPQFGGGGGGGGDEDIGDDAFMDASDDDYSARDPDSASLLNLYDQTSLRMALQYFFPAEVVLALLDYFPDGATTVSSSDAAPPFLNFLAMA